MKRPWGNQDSVEPLTSTMMVVIVKTDRIFSILFFLLYFYQVQAFIGNEIFDTGDPRLFSIFCVNNAAELAAIGETSLTHKEITEAGIIGSITLLMQNLSPSFVPPANPTLSSLFQAYYGDCASPDRFLEAVNDIVTANVDQDALPGIWDNPSIQYDAERFSESQQYLIDNDRTFNTIAGDGRYATAREVLGTGLHTIQGFYAHSNWVELGNSAPPNLVFEQFLPSELAGPTDDTCDSNGLITNLLTSGYFHYNSIPAANKCGHGGPLDLSGLPGINKDTSSSCYSPNANFHQSASAQATSATTNYLEEIRNNIGNGDFQRLFELTDSSAIAVVLDTSGSMGNEINAVRDTIKEIIDSAESGGQAPSGYILAPYENTANLTQTRNTTLVREILDGLSPAGGIENVFGAFLDVLAVAPPFTDIITFTDEPGNDLQLANAVIAQANAKNNKINVIYTAEGTPCPDDLARTSLATGGVCVESSSVNSSDIAALLGTSIGSTKAVFSLVQQVNGAGTTQICVDNGQTNPDYRIGIRISGPMDGATLTSPDGSLSIDLYNDTELASSGLDFDVVFRDPTNLLDLTFRPNAQGAWQLATVSGENGNGTLCNMEVNGICTFNFIPNLEVLFLQTTHPNLKKLQGQPIIGSEPYINIALTGADLQKLGTITNIDFIRPNGQIIHSYSLSFPNGLKENFIRGTSEFPIPAEEFFIQIRGTDSDGNCFVRLDPTKIQPASTSIEVTSSSARIEEFPCNTTTAEFIIFNNGPATTIRTSVTDDEGFYDSSNANSFTLGEGENATLIATFTVDCDAQVGDVSNIVVTAQSDLDSSRNNAFSQLVVISDESDEVAPNCIITSDGTDICSADLTEEDCNTEYWFFEADVSDANSGLRRAVVDFVGASPDDVDLVIDPFTPGSTETVAVSFNASCCVREATLKLLDFVGNASPKEFDLGPLYDPSDVTLCNESDTSVRIDTHNVHHVHDWHPLRYVKWNEYPFNLTIVNAGYYAKITSVVADCDLPPTVFAGALPGRFEFAQMNVIPEPGYRPRVNGSVHMVDDRRFAAEIHFLTYNIKYGTSLWQAVNNGNGNSDTIAAFAVFVKQGDFNHNFENLIEALEYIPSIGDQTYLKPKQLRKFLPYDLDNFWRYYDAIKVDVNCSEIAIWTVFKEPIELSESQIKRLWRFVPPGNYSNAEEPEFPPPTNSLEQDRDLINYIHPFRTDYVWNADLSYRLGHKCKGRNNGIYWKETYEELSFEDAAMKCLFDEYKGTPFVGLIPVGKLRNLVNPYITFNSTSGEKESMDRAHFCYARYFRVNGIKDDYGVWRDFPTGKPVILTHFPEFQPDHGDPGDTLIWDAHLNRLYIDDRHDTYHAICYRNYKKDCDRCPGFNKGQECTDAGDCQDDTGLPQCQCDPGFEGDQCQLPPMPPREVFVINGGDQNGPADSTEMAASPGVVCPVSNYCDGPDCFFITADTFLDRLIACGGSSRVNPQTDGLTCSFLDCESQMWREFGQFPSVIRPAATVIKKKGKEYGWWVTGGVNVGAAGTVRATSFILDKDLEWSEGPRLREPRQGHCMTQIDDCKIAVIGGFTSVSITPPEKGIDVYSFDRHHWDAGPELPLLSVTACGSILDLATYETIVVIGCTVEQNAAQTSSIGTVLHWNTATNKIVDSGHQCPHTDPIPSDSSTAKFKQYSDQFLIFYTDMNGQGASVWLYDLVNGFTEFAFTDESHGTGGLAVTDRGYGECLEFLF